MKTKRVIYKGKKPLGAAMGVRLYNQHYQILMKRVRAGEGSYQQMVREIVEKHFKDERLASKKPVGALEELGVGVDVTWVLDNLLRRVECLEGLCAPSADKKLAQ